MVEVCGYPNSPPVHMNIIRRCIGVKINPTYINVTVPSSSFTLDRLTGQSRIYQGAWRKEDDVFYETAASRECERFLDNYPLIVIVGNSGDGKSAIGKHLGLQHAQKGYLVLKALEAADIIHQFIPEMRVVFLCDDPFGILSYSHSAVDKFIRYEENLRELLYNGRGKVIITCRKQVWNECQSKLACLELFGAVVDISSDELKPKKEERLAILNKHLEKHSIDLPTIDREKIADERSSVGYPLCCKLFANMSNPSERDVEFIRRPLKFLLEELDRQHREDELVFMVLVLVSAFGNSLPISFLLGQGKMGNARVKFHEVLVAFKKEHSTKLLEKLKRRADRLLGVFLTYNSVRETYKFIHHSVFEAVVIKFGNKCPHVLLRWCPNDLIRERFRSMNTESNIENIVVKRDCYRAMALLFIGDIISGYGKLVFLNPSLKDEAFEQAMVAEIKSSKRTRELALKRSLEGFSTMYYAAETGCRHLVELLSPFAKTFAQDDESHHPLVVAASVGHLPVVRLLLNKDVPSSILRASIGEAAFGDHLSVVRFLLGSRHKGVTPDAQGMATVTAVIKNNLSVLQFLCSDQSRVDMRFTVPQQTDIMVKGNKIPSVLYRVLFDSKFLVHRDVMDLFDFTLLHFAIVAESHDAFQYLLDKHISVNSKSGPRRDMTPLHLAVKCGQTDMAKHLLHNGAKINEANKKLRTALHYAVRFGKTHMVDVLLTFGAEVNVKDTKGYTPLDYAHRRGNPRIIRKLTVERGVESDNTSLAQIGHSSNGNASQPGAVARQSPSRLEHTFF